ncbi:MAG TPA: radical SAM protein [Cyclobacteriaceae bacterium]|nr:radical SAM protein [Cyclobacteriaceae bacterium]
MSASKIILFNPRSARHKHRIPNSILQVGASIDGKYEYAFVDGNMEKDPWLAIRKYLDNGYNIFGCTAMPGPQLQQAIPYSKEIRELYPHVRIIWGGYFAANQFKSVINSGCVDYIINGPGDEAFPLLVEAIEKHEKSVESIQNLIYKKGEEIIKTSQAPLLDQDKLPALPYEYLNRFYPLKQYFGKTFLGKRTTSYHSSMGCPFTCSFCAVVPIYNARWKGKSAHLIYSDLKYLIGTHGIDSVEFHDNNFFVSEKRIVEFSKLIKDEKISWWGEGRIDTIDKYSDESLSLMQEAGCKMIFFGAETSNDELLKKMDKGGTQTTAQMKKFAARMKKFGIIPEYSFVLGFPAETPEKVIDQIDRDIAYIKSIKEINPDTEIIIYVYSPVPTEGSELYEKVKATGFSFPEKLEDWLDPAWQNFDLRKNPLTPWLTPEMVDKILGFETVLHAQYPTVSDFRLSPLKRKTMKWLSQFRYRNNMFRFPYELKALQRLWRYRQPEIEGFLME